MRRRERLTPTVTTLIVANSQFAVANIAVKNPTVYPVVMRFGGTDVPRGIDDASDWVAPGTSETFAVEGHNFAFGLATPVLPAPNVNSAYPTTVTITLMSAEETPHSQSSLGLGIVAPSAYLIANTSARLGGTPAVPVTYHDVYTPSPGTRAMVFSRIGTGVGILQVTGNQSGRVYFSSVMTAGALILSLTDLPRYSFPFDPEQDTTITVDAAMCVNSVSATNSYALMGYQDRPPVSMHHQDGRLYVDPIAPGASAVPVSGVNGAAIAVSPSVASLVNSAQAVANPPAGTVLVDSGALPAGNYRAHWSIQTKDAAANQSLGLTQRNAANSADIGAQLVVLTPYQGEIDTYYTLAVNERVRAIVGVLSAVFWSVRLAVFPA